MTKSCVLTHKHGAVIIFQTESAKSGVSMRYELLLSLFIFCFVGGCGETLADRKAISRHTKQLAAIVKANPKSEAANEALAELIDILHGDWGFAGVQACGALGELGPLAAPAVPDLIRAAKCGDSYVRQDSIYALASIGPAAEPALDLFVEIVESAVLQSNAGLRSLYAVEGLGNLGKPALVAVHLLERTSQSDNESLAIEAKKSLEKLRQVEKQNQRR